MDVELYIYDLSNGMARQFSTALIGQQIDAIYHTSVVFNRVEHFFGQGIHRKIPGSTHHGRPMRVVKLGRTQLTMDVIEDYLQSLEAIYTPESYDLFVHNCNNFSQDFAMFLVGKSIPEEIRSLPETFLRTPMGQMLRSQIDQSMRTMTQAPDAVSGRNAHTAHTNGARPVTNGSKPITTGAVSKPTIINSTHITPTPGHVYNITSTSAFTNLLTRASESSAIVFFTSATCPPCKTLYPLYDELAESTPESSCIFIKVDVSQAQEIGSRYSIRATPTFMTFLKGQKMDEWKGADSAALRGNVRLLIQMASPQHPHSNLNCPTFQQLITKPIIFSKVPPLDKLAAKLGTHSTSPAIAALIAHIKTGETEGGANAPLPDLATIIPSLQTIFTSIPTTSQFALVDLLRIAAIDTRISSYLSTNPSLLVTIFNTASEPSAPYNLRLVSCQLACNLWTSPVFQEQLSQPSTLTTAVQSLAAACVVDSTTTPRVAQAAAALVYNLTSQNHNARLQHQPDVIDISEDVEAAVVSAVYEESGSKDTLHSLLLALGMLLSGGEEGNAVEGLCEAMELAECLKEKMTKAEFKGMGILREVREMLAQK